MSLIRPATQLRLHSDPAHGLEPLVTLVGSQPLQPPGADQRAGQVQECGEEVSAPLVANREAPVGQQPRQRPFHLPTVATQPDAGLHPTSGDPRADPRGGARPFGSSGRRPLSACSLAGRRRGRPGRPVARCLPRPRPRAAPAAGSRGCWPPTTQPPTAGRWRRSAGGTWSLACPGRPDSRQRGPPTPGPDTHRVDRGSGPVDLAVVAQPIQQPIVIVRGALNGKRPHFLELPGRFESTILKDNIVEGW